MKILYVLCVFLIGCNQPTSNEVVKKETKVKKTKTVAAINPDNLSFATFGAGCFWCTEAVFEELIGVQEVVSGFAGGKIKNPTYKEVCTGTTGHAEVARISFDPSIISYETLLEVFWTTHNPTTLNRQGADIGEWYRSAIFYHDEEQKAIAEKSKKEVASQLWSDPIVTEISPLLNYSEAEDYHQNYYELNPNYGYCVAVINPKMDKFRKKFADKLKSNNALEQDKSSSGLPPVLKEGSYNELNSKEQYVIDEKGTERSFTGRFVDNKEEGIYICRKCNLPLFKSKDKFKSGTGWPSFDDVYKKDNVKELTDADGRRTEIVCGNCGGHLGHVFKNEGMTNKNTRHCVNSVSLDFVRKSE